MMRQGRVHDGSMGSSRAGLSAETRARVAPIARGNPAPAGSQTEKPCAAESGPTLGGIGRGTCTGADRARTAGGARGGALSIAHDPIRVERGHRCEDTHPRRRRRRTPSWRARHAPHQPWPRPSRRGPWRRRGWHGPRGRRGRRRREKPGRQPFFLFAFLCVREWRARGGRSLRWIAIVVQGRSWGAG